jgi:hypothetical protein
MEKNDSVTHSFIIKIWFEKSTTLAEPIVWRGRITHVPSEEQWYISDLNAIRPIIETYLREMGVDINPASSLKRWWQRYRGFLWRKVRRK